MIDHENALYKELWHACAGPLVTLPRSGSLVYYFPQGHIEQVLLLFISILPKHIYLYMCTKMYMFLHNLLRVYIKTRTCFNFAFVSVDFAYFVAAPVL